MQFERNSILDNVCKGSNGRTKKKEGLKDMCSHSDKYIRTQCSWNPLSLSYKDDYNEINETS